MGLPSGSWNKDRRLGPLPPTPEQDSANPAVPGCTGGPELHIPLEGTLSFKLIHREGSIQLGMLKTQTLAPGIISFPNISRVDNFTYLTAVL